MYLKSKPIHWTPLTKKILITSTPWVAQTSLEWLLSEKYIERPTRGKYIITEKGKLLLKSLC